MRAQKPVLHFGMQIMTAKTTIRTLYVHVVINGVILPQISYNIVPCALHFLPVKFFPKYFFNQLCIQLPQNHKMLRGPLNNALDKYEYRHKWIKIGLSHLLR